MKQPHKHAELIKAWADGAEIERWNCTYDKWYHANKPDWNEWEEYRIKPEPKPDVVRYVYVDYEVLSPITSHKTYADNLRLTFDGETGKLKKAEVLE